MLFNAVNGLFQMYSFLILLRIFLSWVPNIDWYSQPVKFIREVTDVYLNLFRRFIPPIGGFDFSPIVALIALSLIRGIVLQLMFAVLH